MLPAGQMIVSKVFVGRSMPLRLGEQIVRSHYPKAFSVYQNLATALSEGAYQQRRFASDYFSLLSSDVWCFFFFFTFQSRETTYLQNAECPWMQPQIATVVYFWPWTYPARVSHILWIHWKGNYFVYYFVYYVTVVTNKWPNIEKSNF